MSPPLASATETYLRELALVHSSRAGLPETSYYAPLAALLNEIGAELEPKIRCIMGLKNLGAGLPDGGLFTANQFSSETPAYGGQSPARGAIEAKKVEDDVKVTADTQQVQDYLERYGQVLVTNYRAFLLLTKGSDGLPRVLGSIELASDAESFWELAEAPRRTAKMRGEDLKRFLVRVMQLPAPITDPRDLAWFLAANARDAKSRLQAAPQSVLDSVRSELEEALGIKFEGDRGSRFFFSTFVQALFYGLFSAWVFWSQHVRPPGSGPRFEWRKAAWSLNIPMIGPLFSGMTQPHRLGPLNLVDVLDWTEDVLNRVDQEAFFGKFRTGLAIQYFYEPFLEAFDPDLRKELGVWYTPVEIVRYMVERVDAALQTKLGLPDGLADPNVYILDPCCGTGSYLTEVMRIISER
jgi:hypothetical protein